MGGACNIFSSGRLACMALHACKGSEGDIRACQEGGIVDPCNLQTQHMRSNP